MKIRPKPTIVYTTTLEMLCYLLTHGSKQSSYKESLDAKGYSREETGDTFKLFQDSVMMIQGLKNGLSAAASKMIDRIGDELHMNNALWYHKPENNKEYTVLKELIDKCILVRSEDSNIYLVNPFYIRRGSPQSVLSLTMNILRGTTKPTTDHIRELRYSNKVEINPIEVLSAGLLDYGMTKLIPPSRVLPNRSQTP